MYNGKCQSCEEYGEVNDIMLCDDCAEDLEKEDGLSEGEVWAEYRGNNQKKKAQNEIDSIKLLESKGIDYTILNKECRHYRVMGFDFWPSTGKFYNQKTGQKGRGVFNLIKLL
jgi:hypothetical protein